MVMITAFNRFINNFCYLAGQKSAKSLSRKKKKGMNEKDSFFTSEFMH